MTYVEPTQHFSADGHPPIHLVHQPPLAMCGVPYGPPNDGDYALTGAPMCARCTIAALRAQADDMEAALPSETAGIAAAMVQANANPGQVVTVTPDAPGTGR